MARHIQPSRLNGLNAPEIENYVPEGAATFGQGAPVQRHSGDENLIEEFAGGATVTGLLGFAMEGATAGTPDGLGDDVPVAKAGPQVEFFAQVFDVSAAAVATVAGDGSYIGRDFGLIEDSDEWYVDEEDVTNVHVTVTKELPELNGVLFKVLESVRAED